MSPFPFIGRDKIVCITVIGNVLYGVINMVEHYAIQTGVAKDWEGRERRYVALKVRHGDSRFYEEEGRWWFDDFEPGSLDSPADPAVANKIKELMDKYFR